jgi:pyruvate formate lyase activating enzyme
MSIDEVMKTLRRDLPYYIESRGGVTLSGGEPLIQVEAVREIAMRCRNEGIHTAIETAGHVPWSNFERVLPYIDFFYYDLKHIDSVEHHARTGVGLHLILENLRRLSNLTANLVVRVPIVPGMNDSESVMEVLFAFIAQQTGARRVELLPFHRLGMAKYEGLGRPYALEGFGNMSQERCQELAEIGRSLGLAVKVGRENT